MPLLPPPSRPSAPAPHRPLSLDELTAVALARETMSPGALYFGVRGRIGRKTFWLHGVLTLLLVAMLGNALMDIAGVEVEVSGKLVNLLLAWPYIAVSAKRWHDHGFRAWWVLINLAPVVGSLIALLANGFVPGTRGPNRFGPEPLAPARTRDPDFRA